MKNNELIEGSELVFYEYDKLRQTYEMLNEFKSKRPPVEKPLRVAVLESWIIHFRCLYYFLNPQRTDKREFILKDFLSEKEIEEFTSAFEKWQDREYWKDKADTQLSHISKKRLEYNKNTRRKSWNYDIPNQKIIELFHDFLKLANNENLCPDLIKIKASI